MTADGEARATWSGVVEPGDPVAGTLVELLGAVDALAWARAAAQACTPRLWRQLEAVCGPLEPPGRTRIARAVERWTGRLADRDPSGGLDLLRRIGGTLLVPSDPRWPDGLDVLGVEAPFCLWVRGEADLRAALHRAVAVVGSRASTTYGERVAFDVAAGLAGRGACVVSGGAYGIDAAAHRGAAGRTLVVLAGGVDRAYPAGNARLLEAVVASGGALASEVPPTSLPTKSRFLQRNRLIAATGRATVVVEAAWRSGAMSTAHHAARLLRPVGAVPGPVTSMASAGCHRLMREGIAVCVTDADEVAELAGLSGLSGGVSGLAGSAESVGVELSAAERAGVAGAARARDGLDALSQRVLDALPRRVPVVTSRVATAAGVSTSEARAALGLLELDGWAVRRGEGWLLSGASRA